MIKQWAGHTCGECFNLETWRPVLCCSKDGREKLANNPACIYFRSKSEVMKKGGS